MQQSERLIRSGPDAEGRRPAQIQWQDAIHGNGRLESLGLIARTRLNAPESALSRNDEQVNDRKGNHSAGRMIRHVAYIKA